MNEFKIEIVELLSTVVDIKAKDKEQAVQLAKSMYEKEEIILTSEDYVSTEIKEVIE